MPRPYHAPERQKTVDEGRQRLLEAAREVLDLDDVGSFSLDAVAKRAGVTRMTLYNQFGSKAGLLDEVLGLLIERSAFRDASAIFAEADVGRAFDAFVDILGRFYTENQAVLAALSAAGGTDSDLDAALRSRNGRRRRVIETLVQRLDKKHRPAVAASELVNTLDALVAFPTYSAIAGATRTPAKVVPVVQQLVRAAIGFPPGKKGRSRRRK